MRQGREGAATDDGYHYKSRSWLRPLCQMLRAPSQDTSGSEDRVWWCGACSIHDRGAASCEGTNVLHGVLQLATAELLPARWRAAISDDKCYDRRHLLLKPEKGEATIDVRWSCTQQHQMP